MRDGFFIKSLGPERNVMSGNGKSILHFWATFFTLQRISKALRGTSAVEDKTGSQAAPPSALCAHQQFHLELGRGRTGSGGGGGGRNETCSWIKALGVPGIGLTPLSYSIASCQLPQSRTPSAPQSG